MSKRRSNKNKKAGPVTLITPDAVNAPETQPMPEAHEQAQDGHGLDAGHEAQETAAVAEIAIAEDADPSAQESDFATLDEPAAVISDVGDTTAGETPVPEVHDFEDASGALARAIEVDPITITSKAMQVESISIVDASHALTEMGEQGMQEGSDPHAGTAWGSLGSMSTGATVTFDLPESDMSVPDAVEESVGKGKKPDRRLKLNKLQKHARGAPAAEPEAAPAEPEPVPEPKAPREPRIAAFAKLTEYQELSLAHVPGLPEESDVPGHWRGVGFGLGGRRLVTAFDEVVEIMRMPQITHVPGTQSWMLGVANVRGTLLPVVDLKQFLEGERTVIHEGQRVLVVRQSGGNVAVLIDQLYGQRSFNDSQKSGAANDASRYGYFIKQVYRVGDNDWGVFSMSMLTRTPEFRQAAA